jgi:hypothetical protein
MYPAANTTTGSERIDQATASAAKATEKLQRAAIDRLLSLMG